MPDALSAWLSSAKDVRAALASILGTEVLKEPHAVGGQPVQELPAWIKRHEWKRLPFGAFAQNVNERVEPSQAGDEIYVGLEHLDPQDLHIRRWGKGSDVIGTKLRFRKGDVIFGRRRAYQRKLAVAEFDGICSAHAMVVRAKPDVVLSEFLLFLMMSDRFMNRAVEISVGSLSPTINWSTLKLEEFTIPPLGQQRRIAEILWAVDEYTISLLQVTENLESLRQSVSEEALRGGWEKKRTNGNGQIALSQKRIDDICERVSVGIVVTPSKYYQPTGVRCFRSANVRRGYVNDKDWVFISEEAHRLHSKSILHAGDVLVVRSGVFAGMSCVVPVEYDRVNCIDVVFATPRREVVASEWLSLFINSAMGQAEIRRGERGLAQKHFGVDAMKNLKVPLPPLEEQLKYLARLNQISEAVISNQTQVNYLRQTTAAIVEQLFKT